MEGTSGAVNKVRRDNDAFSPNLLYPILSNPILIHSPYLRSDEPVELLEPMNLHETKDRRTELQIMRRYMRMHYAGEKREGGKDRERDLQREGQRERGGMEGRRRERGCADSLYLADSL